MSLKSRLRLAIIVLVTVVLVAVSALFLNYLGGFVFTDARQNADQLAHIDADFIVRRINQEMKARKLHPATLAQYTELWTTIPRTDPSVAAWLHDTTVRSDLFVNVRLNSADGTLLASAFPIPLAQPEVDLADISSRKGLRNLWDLWFSTRNYSSSVALGIPSSTDPVLRLTVVVSPAFLKNTIRPTLSALGVGFLISLALAIALATFLPTLVLAPLLRVSRKIDLIRAGEVVGPDLEAAREGREFADVQSKLSLLGEQFRGAQRDANEMRVNVERLLRRMEQAVLLFDAGGRLIMAGEATEALLGVPRDALTGHSVRELFVPLTAAGAAIADALEAGDEVRDRVVTIQRPNAAAMRVFLTMERMDGRNGSPVGTMITLRDVESRRQLAGHLELSSRLTAISRITAGVAHEIKNPLNAMALHLEVLRNRLEGETGSEIEVIASEIKRLDHVVKTFLSFNKPIDPAMNSLDLGILAADVVALVMPQAQDRGVRVHTDLNDPAWISGDRNLLQQAVLNVIVNAIEAMESGGTLRIAVQQDNGDCVLSVADNGPGIPPEVQDRIYDLYFSTKKKGSGIGLAMTFRLVQLHSGTIDFTSEQGKGTTFRLRFPRLTGEGHLPHPRLAASSIA